MQNRGEMTVPYVVMCPLQRYNTLVFHGPVADRIALFKLQVNLPVTLFVDQYPVRFEYMVKFGLHEV